MKLIFGDPESIAARDRGRIYQRGHRKKLTSAEKIARMHDLYGVTENQQCKTCVHFRRYQPGANVYRKCKLYGVSSGPATDWCATFKACGKWKQPALGKGAGSD